MKPPNEDIVEQFIFDLCDGDISKRDWVKKNMTVSDGLLWNARASYQAYLTREYSKHG